MSPEQVAVAEYIGAHPGCTRREIADGTGLTYGRVDNCVASLYTRGVIDHPPAAINRIARRWYLDGQVPAETEAPS